MIDGKDLNRCIDILSELNANTTSIRDKKLILELGYIIKQELDLVKAWEDGLSEQSRLKYRTKTIDVNKLLEDNVQLYKDNEKLIKSVATLKGIIDTTIPSIEKKLGTINKKFDFLNNSIETNLC